MTVPHSGTPGGVDAGPGDRLDALEPWGWDEAWAEALPELRAGWEPARVSTEHRTRWEVQTAAGPRDARAEPPTPNTPRPTVGDWVVVGPGETLSDPWVIRAVLPRRTRFSRGSAYDGSAEHVLAANVDRVWIVHGLDTPLKPRKLERYLAVAWESGATPEVVLTKSDLTESVEETVDLVRSVGFGTRSWVVSESDEPALRELAASLERGVTVALLGPSGVGKSTLVNLLGGSPLAATGSVRDGDRKGRHTSTTRELFLLPGRGLLLDTPGLRQLRIWDLDSGLAKVFPEIDELAAACRFRDCRHDTEPGCAVLGAVDDGTLDAERFASFRKLEAEAAYQLRKADPRARAEAIADHKAAIKTLKHHPKHQARK